VGFKCKGEGLANALEVLTTGRKLFNEIFPTERVGVVLQLPGDSLNMNSSSSSLSACQLELDDLLKVLVVVFGRYRIGLVNIEDVLSNVFFSNIF